VPGRQDGRVELTNVRWPAIESDDRAHSGSDAVAVLNDMMRWLRRARVPGREIVLLTPAAPMPWATAG